jgi:hypothetical protein
MRKDMLTAETPRSLRRQKNWLSDFCVLGVLGVSAVNDLLQTH